MQSLSSNTIPGVWNVVAFALAIVCFVVDLILPRGLLAGVPFFFVIWLAYFSRSPRSVAVAVVLCSLLSFTGLIYSPDVLGISWSVAITNRIATVLALIVNGIFIYYAMTWQQRLEAEIFSARVLAEQLSTQHDSIRAQSRAMASMMEDLNHEREQLRTSEELFRVTIEANPTAIIMTNEKGIIHLFNREAQRIFGYPDNSLTGIKITNLLPDLQFGLEYDSREAPAPASWDTVHSEMTARTKSGEKLTVQVNKAFVTTKNSLLALITVIDISAVKESARKLQQAREVAERASRARGEFLANMSHEIRTPMTAILGYVEIISERTEDPDNLQALDTIRNNGRHLLQIINDILDLSKIDAGKLSVSKEMANIGEIVGEIRSLMDVQASDNRVTLDFEFANEIPEEIETDPLRVRQILLNLIGNAIKFTPKGSVVVATSYRPADNLMQFDIRDTGIGISAQDLKRLFQPFAQVDSSTTREYEGSGLGLVISRRLAQALGGDLTVVSELGVGSTFTLTIACGNVSQKRTRPNPVISPNYLSSATKPAPQICGTVLVVDDRRDIRFLAQHLIEKAGGIVWVATNGKEAIELLNGQDPESHHARSEEVDLVLMDMQMPVMDGYEATRILRSHGFNKPIIALTANAMIEDRDKCLDAGCTDFITKPIDSRKLISLLIEVLKTTAKS